MDEEGRAASIVTRLVVVVFLEWLGATSVLPLLPLYLKDKGATPATTGRGHGVVLRRRAWSASTSPGAPPTASGDGRC